MKVNKMARKKDYIALKWGTLKGWELNTPELQDLLKEYMKIGNSASAMLQEDTPRQQKIIIEMIEKANCNTIYLDWYDKNVSKEKAIQYIKNYERALR